MWFESTPLVADGNHKLSRKRRQQEESEIRLFKAEKRFREFALGLSTEPILDLLGANVRIINLRGHIHVPDDAADTTRDDLLGVTGELWHVELLDANFIQNFALSRCVLVDRSEQVGNPPRCIVWTITWLNSQGTWDVVNSHASFGEYPVWVERSDWEFESEFAGEVQK